MSNSDSLYSLTAGDLIVLQGILANAGLDADMGRSIIEKPSMAVGMVEAAKDYQWYESPEKQLDHVRRLIDRRSWEFTESDLPAEIPSFEPRTESEVLMIAGPLPPKGNEGGDQRTMNELLGCIELPGDFDKERLIELVSDHRYLRLVPGNDHQAGWRWVGFDKDANSGMSIEACRHQPTRKDTRLAASEVLMAAILFPRWVIGWHDKQSTSPNMAGYEFTRQPYINWQKTSLRLKLGERDHMLRIEAIPVDEAVARSSSPTVREL